MFYTVNTDLEGKKSLVMNYTTLLVCIHGQNSQSQTLLTIKQFYKLEQL